MFDIEVGNIKLLDKYDYYAVNGKKYLIIHGDFFDALMLNKKWLMHIGDTAYNIMIWINTHFNFVRSLFGMEYWSLSKWLKRNTKEALNFIHNFEDHVSTYCKNGNYDGIICGHIHTAEIKNINDVEYMNSGDWVESCTAIVEHMNGNFELIEKIRVEKTYEQDTIDN
jgi:UDP-2,3-diacylglucosamine pyrophosphatase LpxH